MREIWFGLLILLSLAGVSPLSAQTPADATAGALAVGPEDRVLGKPDASITIIEYASFTCPHCAHFAIDVLPKLKEKWIDSGKARLVVREFPRDEPDLRAAMVARCAPPDRYFPLIDTLFEQQEKWVLARDYRAALETLAKLAGIGSEEFGKCLADKKLEETLLQGRLTAVQTLGVNSTPTFFINGKKFDGEPTVEAIDKQLTELAPK
jgi:protein-disulfide isomerase